MPRHPEAFIKLGVNLPLDVRELLDRLVEKRQMTITEIVIAAIKEKAARELQASGSEHRQTE